MALDSLRIERRRTEVLAPRCASASRHGARAPVCVLQGARCAIQPPRSGTVGSSWVLGGRPGAPAGVAYRAPAGAPAWLPRSRAPRLALHPRRGPLLPRCDDESDDDQRGDRAVSDLPAWFPHDDRGDFPSERVGSSCHISRAGAGIAALTRSLLLRTRKPVVGLGGRSGRRLLLRCTHGRHVLLLRRRHVPQPHRLPIPVRAYRCGPHRNLLFALYPRRSLAGPLGLLGGSLPSGL